jgi:sporulation protein YlmC with PRC-barrel domain
LRPFIETEFVQVPAELLDLVRLSYSEDEDLLSLPFASLELPFAHTIHDESHELLLQQYEAVPPGELAIRRGARVQATDGCVGRVDELVVDPESRQITHVMMRRGHLWGEQEISIPVSEIARIAEDVVHLKLDKRQIKALPAVKVRRKWQ